MNIELLLFGFGCGVAGIVIGLVVANIFRADVGTLNKVKAQLKEAEEKLKKQAEHFAESENMLHKLGTDLRDLYQHMSKNEISTLKERFKGLVIEADAHLDELAHETKAAGDAVEPEEAVENVDQVIDELAEETIGKVEEVVVDVESTENVEEVEAVEKPAEEMSEAEEKKETEVETSDEIKDKINETMDELSSKKD